MHERAASGECDEFTENRLDFEEKVKGNTKELQKLEQRPVYFHVDEEGPMGGVGGKFVEARRVLPEKGEDVRCWFVAQQFV